MRLADELWNSSAETEQGLRFLPISTRKKKRGWNFRMPYNRREVNGISGLCIDFEYYLLHKVYNLKPDFLVKFALNYSTRTGRVETPLCTVDAFNAFWTTGKEARFHSMSSTRYSTATA